MTRSLVSILAAALLASCGNDTAPEKPDGPLPPDAPPGDPRTFADCDGDAASFVRQAFVALDGRRPRSQAEVDTYVDLYKQATDQGRNAQEIVARAIMARPEFTERWVDVLMDAMIVQRIDEQSEAACWDTTLRPTTTPALAAAVRDQPATGIGDAAPFSMLDLARSAIALDDVSPIYRGQIFSFVSHPTNIANAGLIEGELARRADFGVRFEAGFLNRDTVCLGCHTSETSVTNSDDPELDRHWPVPGAPERAVYGQATGVAVERAHAMFRVEDFVSQFGDEGPVKPWGWTPGCGSFATPETIPTDPAGIEAKFVGISGQKATVFDLDAAMHRGFGLLRAAGAPSSELTDPDHALAWLIALKITEDVWRQATGTQLTIANYFPRNEAAANLLYSLAQRFVASGYSLKTLLVAIVSSDYFNRLPADAQCGAKPYAYPNVFDPWVISDSDAARRLNGPGDAVTSIDGRTLISATTAALEWPANPSRFPADEGFCQGFSCSTLNNFCTNQGLCCVTHAAQCLGGPPFVDEVAFQRGIGVFLRNSERGFRGLDFQARLAWEDRFGACTKPVPQDDFIDRLAFAARADAQATVRDAIAALKDRLIGEPVIADGAETTALAAIVGNLDAPATNLDAAPLRRVCGALLGSPQFLLQGIAGRGGPRPRLTPATAGYNAVCADLAATGIGTPGLAVTCSDNALVLAPGFAPRLRAPAIATPAPARKQPPHRPDPRRMPRRPARAMR